MSFFLRSFDFIALTSTQRRFYEMACASIKIGAIPTTATKFTKLAINMTADRNTQMAAYLNFSTTPIIWVDWAVNKGFKLPKTVIKFYEEYQKAKNERPNESYRPVREIEDKYVVQQVMLTVREFIPDLPLEQLVKTPPIQRIARDATNETLAKWDREAGIITKKGRPRDGTKQECLKPGIFQRSRNLNGEESGFVSQNESLMLEE